MDAEETMEMCEEGRAQIVYGDVLLMRSGGEYYMSLDGKTWEKTSSDIVKREFGDG